MDQNLIVKQEDRNFINKAKKFMSEKANFRKITHRL